MVWDHAHPFMSLLCKSASGDERIFEIRVEGGFDSGVPVWFYYAKPTQGALSPEEEYLATFKQVRDALLQLDWMSNGLPGQYRGYGITRTLIPHVARKHQARIRSSRDRPDEGETHTQLARRVWQRLVREDLACYDATEDRFYHPAVPPGAA